MLTSLSLGSVALTPAFAGDVTEYTADVAHDVAQVTVAATAAPGVATTITPADADSRKPGHQVDLPVPAHGDHSTMTAIAVAVRSADNKLNSYTITVNRAAAGWFDRVPGRDIDNLGRHLNGWPSGIWSDGDTMWIADIIVEKVFAYRLATGARRPNKDINNLGVHGNEAPAAMWSDGTTLWIVDILTHKVYAYDLASKAHHAGKDIENSHLAGYQRPRGFWSDGTTAWIADYVYDDVHAYDLDSKARRADRDITTLAAAGNRYMYAMWSDGLTLWVVDRQDVKIYAYDLATGERHREMEFNTLRAAGNDHPTGMWSDGTTMWVADSHDNKVYAYNMPVNSLLESFELTGANLKFSSNRREFALRAPSTLTTTTVLAAAASSDAEVAISPADADDQAEGHQVDLSAGDNTITVTVTNGTATTTYTAVVTQVAAATLSDDASLSALSLSGVDIGAFSSSVTSYEADISGTTETITVTPTTTDDHALVAIRPPDADTLTDGHQISLVDGKNTIKIVVESADGTATQTYAVTLNRPSTEVFGRNILKDITSLEQSGNDFATGIWSDGTTVWLADHVDDKVYAYELATGARQADADLDTLDAGNGTPSGMWSDGTTLWIVNYWNGHIYAYDLTSGERQTNREIFGLNAAGNGDPYGLWSDGDTMWVSDYIDDKIYAYDTETGRHVPSKDIDALTEAGSYSVRGIWSDGDTMWAVDRWADKVFAFDVASGAHKPELSFKARYETPHRSGTRQPRGIWSDGTTMWVVDHVADTAYAYNMQAAEDSPGTE